MKNPVCPTCGGLMVGDYKSGMWGKDYYWRCSKKKKHNPSCLDRNTYYECDKHSRILCQECCFKKEGV